MSKEKYRVLIIRDAIPGRISVRRVLARSENPIFESCYADSIPEGEELLVENNAQADTANPFSAVILDLEMLDSNKWNFIRKTRSLYPKTAVLAMAHDNQPEMADKAYRSGVHDFLAIEILRTKILVESIVNAAHRAGGRKAGRVTDVETRRNIQFRWHIKGQLARACAPRLGDSDIMQRSVDEWIGEVKSHGVKSILCLLDGNELHALYNGIPKGLLSCYESHGFSVGHISVANYSVPPLKPRQLRQVWRLYQKLPKPILVHCRFGVARTGHAVDYISQKLLFERLLS